MRLIIITLFIFTFLSCNNNTPAVVADNPVKKDTATEKVLFFPVTAYLKGQIADILKTKKPLKKYIISGTNTDSVKATPAEFQHLAAEFLHPRIDSANLLLFYSESKFLDQTVNAITFTYEAKRPLPDSVTLQHWDVYMDPEIGSVKRIYMVKKVSAEKQLQLTWQSDQWCKITTIVTRPDGASAVEKEEKISWEY
jgi:hypothetical protein